MTDPRASGVTKLNYESAGFDQGTIGVIGCEGDLKGLFNAAQNDFDSPPGFYPTDAFPGLTFYTNVTDAVFWSIPIARILSCKNGAPIRQAVTFEAAWKSNGSFSTPTGSR